MNHHWLALRHFSISLTVALALVFGFFEEPLIAKNADIKNFSLAKKYATEIHRENPKTLYCGCDYSKKSIDLRSCGYQVQKDAKRAVRLEWEHVVPAEAFGQSFIEWREGAPQCQKKGRRFKGRKCAEKNAEFARMEADLYNLWPEIGELNGLRSNYSMAELGAEKAKSSRFGACKVMIEDHKFEPMPQAKGRVARVYLYMDQTYPGRGIISDKNRKLFEAWDKLHPVDPWECRRAALIKKIQKNENSILKTRCGNTVGAKR
jgi:deoxyribonuclease-1